MITNFGSQCDLPADGEPQCKELVNLYKKHKDEGFQVVAFLTEQFRDKSMLGMSYNHKIDVLLVHSKHTL